MKLLLSLLLVLLTGCATQSYFKSPNDVFKEKVVLYLLNKPPVSGTLTITFENDFNRDLANVQAPKFMPEGKNEEEKIDIKEIVGYTFDKNYYALKQFYLFTNNSYHFLFGKRLTGEASKIQLYELYETGKGNATGQTEYSYFITMPGFGRYETLNTHSEKLTPNFDLKMSELVADCPTVAQKIRNKQKDYFIPVVSFNTFKHKEVMMKIIEDYNNCK